MGGEQKQANIVVVCHHQSCSVTVCFIWVIGVDAGSSAARRFKSWRYSDKQIESL
jgi:hypothetical protein